jgi:hypothetical protein
MPSSTGLPSGLLARRFGLALTSSIPRGRPARPAARWCRPVGDLDLLQHLANDHLDVLVVDLHALQPIDFLDFVDEILGQRLDAQTSRMSCGTGLPSIRLSPFLTKSPSWTDHLALGDQVFDRLAAVSGSIDDAALGLVVLAEFDAAVDLGDDRVSFGLRASNSSATRGRPPVMSRVLALRAG